MRFFIKIICMVGIAIVLSVTEIIYSTNVFFKITKELILIAVFLYLLNIIITFLKLYFPYIYYDWYGKWFLKTQRILDTILVINIMIWYKKH